ncbi:hypothetical protein LCGC14_2759110 [marine sediment metagenome]|uniref:Uncharacterized protein n=1 Tax=marine sediment metagenome TaxID=412755 RepID=A0A0F9BR59_9ZZZZ
MESYECQHRFIVRGEADETTEWFSLRCDLCRTTAYRPRSDIVLSIRMLDGIRVALYKQGS